ncbi:TIGR00730 family Rossman fold protein [Patescibacteria group bacterium]|nr:TIGR00730 family Rossman fold protein [Patescibacteria group bacterium]
MPKKPFYKYHEPVNFRDTWRIFKIMAEFVEGYQFVAQFRKEITFFGSARTKPADRYYKLAKQTAYLLGKKKHTIITGGGPGIMEAANWGATNAKAESVGINIQLPSEQVLNKYVKKSWGFHYFFTRKVMLTAPSQAFLYYPGGFGTLDEFFEVMDTIELEKMPKVPVGIFGKEYWNPLIDFLKKSSVEGIGAISEQNLKLFKIMETPKEAVQIISKTHERPFFAEFAPEKFSTGESANWRIFRIMSELVEGFEFATKLKDDVTILGTKSIKQDSPYYHQAYELANKLGKLKYSIVTGGGPGIMEAANHGAYDAGVESIGMNMKFDHQIRTNQYVTSSASFFFPFTRKLILTAPSLGFIIFPGGYGTLHQLFEILTLMQTGKIGRMPVILFGKKFWKPLDEFIENLLAKKFKTINPADRDLYKIVDKIEDAVRIIKQVPRNLKK